MGKEQWASIIQARSAEEAAEVINSTLKEGWRVAHVQIAYSKLLVIFEKEETK
jgi:hypothetical protein